MQARKQDAKLEMMMMNDEAKNAHEGGGSKSPVFEHTCFMDGPYLHLAAGKLSEYPLHRLHLNWIHIVRNI